MGIDEARAGGAAAAGDPVHLLRKGRNASGVGASQGGGAVIGALDHHCAE